MPIVFRVSVIGLDVMSHGVRVQSDEVSESVEVISFLDIAITLCTEIKEILQTYLFYSALFAFPTQHR